MTALKAMVAAGNYPTASQMLGYTVLDYAAAGKMGDLTETAKKEGWDKVGSGGAAEVRRSMTASGSRLRSTSTRSTGCGSTRP